MVDCGSARCYQERRIFRKELLSWSKKIPILVGLERVAEELFGQETISTLLQPFNCLEPDEVEDWEPSENCFYCEDKVQLIFDTVEKLAEDAKEGKNFQENPCLRNLQDILPFCPQFYTHNFGRELLAELKSGCNTPVETECEVNVPHPSKCSVELKVPHVVQSSKSKKDSSVNGKKAYTDEELSAAVSDIRSGKLGTRRAAVLYGIPRSTLRNKIFKMGCDDPQSLSNDFDSSEKGGDVQGITEQSLELADLLHMTTFPYILPLAMTCPIREEVLEPEDIEWMKKLEYIRYKHNIRAAPMDHYEEKASSHNFKIPLIVKVIKSLVQEKFKASQLEESEQMSCHSPLTSSLPFSSFGSSFNIFKDTYFATKIKQEPQSVLPSVTVPSYSPAKGQVATSVVNTPPKRPYQSVYDKYENTRIGDTLKDIIAKSISEKVRGKFASSSDSDDQTSGDSVISTEYNSSKDTSVSAFSIPNHSIPSAKRFKRELGTESKHFHKSQGKKTRPKRGQYRKYNSQLLVEAVRAVQRGEMSVHRAGSYFGVPHSTLEYKVKERHLLRQKKIKEQQQKQQSSSSSSSNSSGTSSTKSKSSNNSSISEEDKFEEPFSTASESVTVSPPKTSFPGPSWLPPYFVAPSAFDNAASLGIFDSGFALSTPASELLRKLQHKVQNKTNTFSQENFSFPPSSALSHISDRFLYIN
ncbi:hypothetical protein CHS0354_014694 [Potamilus streckersoni]|uniref:HTH psq-type domain-containing protein n=1 Tax=Potamilus streckersoni TaxID=2493646 RepID=A0AAE0SQB7_9BIVA|nr:hypothetical protein CHS0354_014694 [Potamilus streckersoni]